MKSFKDFAAENPSDDKLQPYRGYSDYAKRELLATNQWDDEVVGNIDGLLIQKAVDAGVDLGEDPVAGFFESKQKGGEELVARWAENSDVSDAARTLHAMKSDKVRNSYEDPEAYEAKLETDQALYSSLVSSEDENRAKRKALNSGDLPFAVLRDEVDGEFHERLELSPSLIALAGDDKALAMHFAANPELDAGLISAVRRKLSVPEGYTVPEAELDRKQEFFQFIGDLVGSDDGVSKVVANSQMALDKGFEINPWAVDKINLAISAKGFASEYTPEEREKFTRDFLTTLASPETNTEDLDSNVKILSGGEAHIPMGVMLKKDVFDKTVRESKIIPESQKQMLIDNREAKLSAYAPGVFNTIIEAEKPGKGFTGAISGITDTITKPGDKVSFLNFFESKKSAGATDAEILDEWMSNPDNHSKFRDMAGGAIDSVVDAGPGLVMGVAAMFGNEAARDGLIQLQKRDAARRAQAQVFGQNLGFGYDAMKLVAPVVADVGITLTTGALGAGAVAAKTSLRAGIKGMIRESLSVEAKGLLSGYAKRQAIEGVGVEQILTKVGQDLSKRFTKTAVTSSYLSTAFARSAGSTYASIYSTLEAQTNPDGTPKFSQEELRDKSLKTSMVSGMITTSLVGGFSFLGKAGMERIYSGMTRRQLGGVYNRMKADWGKLAPSVKEGIDMASATSMLASVYKKSATSFFKTIGKPGLEEGAEEALDQMGQYFNEKIATGEEINIMDAVKEAGYAGLLGAAMGSGVVLTKETFAGAKPSGSVELKARMEMALDTATRLNDTSPETAAVLRRFAFGLPQQAPQNPATPEILPEGPVGAGGIPQAGDPGMAGAGDGVPGTPQSIPTVDGDFQIDPETGVQVPRTEAPAIESPILDVEGNEVLPEGLPAPAAETPGPQTSQPNLPLQGTPTDTLPEGQPDTGPTPVDGQMELDLGTDENPLPVEDIFYEPKDTDPLTPEEAKSLAPVLAAPMAERGQHVRKNRATIDKYLTAKGIDVTGMSDANAAFFIDAAREEPVVVAMMHGTPAGPRLTTGQQAKAAAQTAIDTLPASTKAGKAKVAKLTKALGKAKTLDQFADIVLAAGGGAVSFNTPKSREIHKANKGILKSHNFAKGTRPFLESVSKSGSDLHKGIADLLLRFPTMVDGTTMTTVDMGGNSFAGAFLKSSGQVLVNPRWGDDAGVVDTVLHELLHAATQESVSNPNKEQAGLVNKLDRIRENMVALADPKFATALSNTDEFITHMFTDKAFQEEVSRLTQEGDKNWLQVVIDTLVGLVRGGKVGKKDELSKVMGDMISLMESQDGQWGPVDTGDTDGTLKSITDQDAAYMEAVESGDVETQQRMVDTNVRSQVDRALPMWKRLSALLEKLDPFNTRETSYPELESDPDLFFSVASPQGAELARSADMTDAEKMLFNKATVAIQKTKPDARMEKELRNLGDEKSEIFKLASMLSEMPVQEVTEDSVEDLTVRAELANFFGDRTEVKDAANKEANLLIGLLDQIGQPTFTKHSMWPDTDPATYDADGNVIPLSERFNQETPDIRFKQIEDAPVVATEADFETPASVDSYLQSITPEGYTNTIDAEDFHREVELADKWVAEDEAHALVNRDVAHQDALGAGSPENTPSRDHAPEAYETYKALLPKGKVVVAKDIEQRPATRDQVDLQNQIAKMYEALPEDGSADPEVPQAYANLAKEVLEQYSAIQDAGITFEVVDDSPYNSSSEMVDAVKSGVLQVQGTDAKTFGDNAAVFEDGTHPMLQDTGLVDLNGRPMLVNDVFRGVHDYIAHAAFGSSFGPIGEESAWRAHLETIKDPLARRAITTETRGQNSWVNYSDSFLRDGVPIKKGQPGFVNPVDRPFATQKYALLPESALEQIGTAAETPTTSPENEQPLRDLLDNTVTGNVSKERLAQFRANPEIKKSTLSYLEAAAKSMWNSLQKRFDTTTAVQVDRLAAMHATLRDGTRSTVKDFDPNNPDATQAMVFPTLKQIPPDADPGLAEASEYLRNNPRPAGDTSSLIDLAGEPLLNRGDLGDLDPTTLRVVQAGNDLILANLNKRGTAKVGRVKFSEFLTGLWKARHRGRKMGWHNFDNTRSIRGLAKSLAYETARSLTKDGSGKDWYRGKISGMFESIENTFPELRTSEEARFTFSAILAITSNGQDVFSNMQDAANAYAITKVDGALPEDYHIQRNERGAAVRKSFKKLNKLLNDNGWEKTRDDMLSKTTYKQMKKKYGVTTSEEVPEQEVVEATFLGPKIGSFFANINGQYDSVTMDLWFSRTMARLSGDLGAFNPEKALLTKLRMLVEDPTLGVPKDVVKQIGELLAHTKKNSGWATSANDVRSRLSVLYDWAKQTKNGYSARGFLKEERTLVNLSAKAFIETLDGGADTPDSSHHRVWMREVFAATQKELRNSGIDLTNADLQAILWFHEKDLYTRFGATSSRGEKADYQDAAERLDPGNIRFPAQGSSDEVAGTASSRGPSRPEEAGAARPDGGLAFDEAEWKDIGKPKPVRQAGTAFKLVFDDDGR